MIHIKTPDELRIYLANLLLQMRKSAGLSQMDFSIQLNRAQSQVATWENVANGKPCAKNVTTEYLLNVLFSQGKEFTIAPVSK
jgi:DNA-binding transcriptional regulator YiaG